MGTPPRPPLAAVALEAQELGALAEVSVESAAHERAARKYVEAAKRVRDPTTRRAIALVGHAHARRAAFLKRHPDDDHKAPKPPPEESPVSSSSVDPPSGTLCVPDLLALERRLHALGVGGRSRPTRSAKPVPWVRRETTEIVTAYVGTLSPDHPSELPSHDREEHLARGLKRLSDENASLRRDRDALAAKIEAADRAKRDVDEFKHSFQKKFDALKKRLDEFRREYPNANNPANALVDPQQPQTYTQLQDELKTLHERLKQEQDFSRKKDKVIERYEHWYRALKASANKRRPASSSRPALPDDAKQQTAGPTAGQQTTTTTTGGSTTTTTTTTGGSTATTGGSQSAGGVPPLPPAGPP
ncbi:hypothetical protein CTAYLR_007406 [Chrysophaeum taylorii]|uniref:Uncharacterized protein n=1 Tax=Chrysophaeum taylorii TaxID=2483200 RepID=A0AAD7XJ65_9STRA|nr:hypothetical protein CTAYLR_007406 [Chrysophaeum taylorii]